MSRQIKLRICMTLFVLAVVSMVIGVTSGEKAYAIYCCEDCDPNLTACYEVCHSTSCCGSYDPTACGACLDSCDSNNAYCWGHCGYCYS